MKPGEYSTKVNLPKSVIEAAVKAFTEGMDKLGRHIRDGLTNQALIKEGIWQGRHADLDCTGVDVQEFVEKIKKGLEK
jgi:hypothetical protein